MQSIVSNKDLVLGWRQTPPSPPPPPIVNTVKDYVNDEAAKYQTNM